MSQEMRVISREDAEAMSKRILDMAAANEASVELNASAMTRSSFALNDSHEATYNRSLYASLTIDVNGKLGSAATNLMDDAGLKEMVAAAHVNAAAHRPGRRGQGMRLLGPQNYPEPPRLFFESVQAGAAPDARASLFHMAAETAEKAGLVSAGDMHFEMSANALFNTRGLFTFSRDTYADFSMTARTKNGTGSGWAWNGHEDWARTDPAPVVARAVDLAKRSENPVAVEPGRYTVILEPAAVATLVAEMVGYDTVNMSASSADNGSTVYANDPVGTNKIGLKMIDERLSLVADPWDPDSPSRPFTDRGDPLSKVVWFERGILKNLAYSQDYAIQKKRERLLNPGGGRLYAEGATQTLEEMIATTQRGIWVNRLSNVALMNPRSLLITGNTRDGTFLIENGKITKAIKNFRFMESPFFVLNKLESFGDPVRASRYNVAPRLKVRDFTFTSLTNAV
jgi:predicted Zn-dependent protease